MLRVKSFLENKKVVLWDWNGTLINDFELAFSIFSGFLEEHGMDHVSEQTYREKIKFPIRDFYTLMGYDFTKISFEELSKTFYARYDEGVEACQLHDGVVEMMTVCQGIGIRQYILTAAQEDHVKKLVGYFKIDNFLAGVFGLKGRTADSKVERAKELMRTKSLNVDDCILVGDTLHDLEVGQALSMDVVLVGNGYQCLKVLQGAHKNVVARN